jgi:hypothetical protein
MMAQIVKAKSGERTLDLANIRVALLVATLVGRIL